MSVNNDNLVAVPLTRNDIALVMRRELENALQPLLKRVAEIEAQLDKLTKKNKTTE